MPPSFAEILVEGPDTRNHLHGQLAADVQSIDVGQWRYASYCMPDGRVQALMMVARTADQQLRLLLPEELAASVAARLLRYRLRARCEVSWHTVTIAAVEPETAAAGRHYACDAFCWRVQEAASTPTAGAIWAEQITLAIPWLVTATSEKFLPQMLGMERLLAFSLRKGCFPGQEVVARTHFLGRSKRHLARLDRVEGTFEVSAGAELFSTDGASNPCGWMIADAFPQGPAALAVLTESATSRLHSDSASVASSAGFVINLDVTETKGDKLLNGRYLATTDA